jgi:hypothetical protein
MGASLSSARCRLHVACEVNGGMPRVFVYSRTVRQLLAIVSYTRVRSPPPLLPCYTMHFS